MKINWRKVWVGVKIALGVAIKLNDAKVIRVKELDKATPIIEAIRGAIEAEKPKP